jgi:hypothetical protein
MQYTPAIGDLLVREKALGFFNHVGVMVAPNAILQNTPEKGEHLAALPEFAAGEQVKVVTTGADRSLVSVRAQHVLANPKAYNPLSRNCEHTVYEVVSGVAKSPQLLLWVGVAIIVGIVAVVLLRR